MRPLALAPLALALAFSPPARAGSGGAAVRLTHSGYLLDASDAPARGTLPFTFRLYKAATGGAAEWTGACSLAVDAGYYATTLGAAPCSGDGLDLADLDAAAGGWIEVTIGAATLTPRQQVSGVPLATLASDAARLGGELPSAFARASDLAEAETRFGDNFVALAGAQSITGLKTFAGGLRLMSGTPGPGAILLSDATGLATWAPVPFGANAGDFAQGNDSRFTNARAPAGSAGGDLSGTYPNPIVSRVAGRPVSTALPDEGQVLRWDGAQWAPGAGGSTAPAGTGPIFTDVTGACAGQPYVSNAVVPTTAARVYAVLSGPAGASLVKNDVDSGKTTVAFDANDRLAVRLTAAATDVTATGAIVAFKGVAGSFAVETGADVYPDAFTFTNVANAELDTDVTSAPVTLANFSGTTTATVTGHASAVLLKNGVPSGTSVSVAAGNTLAVRLRSASAFATAITVNVTTNGCGSGSAWTVTTRPNSRVSCLAHFEAGVTTSGPQPVDPDGSGAIPVFTAYCDMSGAGGWTLVSRMKNGCATYAREAVGTLTSPSQPTCAKLSDTVINALRTASGATGVFRARHMYPGSYAMPADKFLKIVSGTFDSYDTQGGLTQQCSCSPSGPWSGTYGAHSTMAGVYTHSAGWQCVTAGQTGCTASTTNADSLFIYQHALRQNGTFPADSHGVAGGSDGYLFIR